MRIILITALFAILYLNAIAQDPIYLENDQEFPLFVTADYIPEPIKAKGGVQLFVGHTGEYNVAVWYQTNAGKMELFQVLKTDETEEIFLNYAKAYWDATFTNDTLYFASEFPFRATQFHYFFVWDGQEFVFINMELIDPSWEMVQKAEEHIEKGELHEAVHAYEMVGYPFAYFNMGEVCKILILKAHAIGLEHYQKKEYRAAPAMLDSMLNSFLCDAWLNYQSREEFVEAIERTYGTWTEDSLLNILGDYGLFLYKARELDKSIDVNSRIIIYKPEFHGAYLQLGDALFDQNDKNSAGDIYKRYITLMEKKGLGKMIPKRAKDRAKIAGK